MPRKMRDSGVEWIGAIPEGWRVGRVKNQYFHVKEIAGSRAAQYERLALTLAGVVRRPKDDVGGLQPEEFESYQVLRSNELVFKLIDLQNVRTSRVGRCSFDEGIVSPAYQILHPRISCNPQYGEYYFLAMWMHEIFNTMGDDAVRSCLNKADLLNIPYLMPSSSEQIGIVNYLDTQCAEIDAAIASARQSIEDYKALKKSLIFEVVTGKRKLGEGSTPRMRDSGNVLIGDIPAEWEMLPLRRLGNLANGISKGGECFGSGYPFVSYSDVFKNDVLPATVKGLVESDEEDRSRYSVRRGDVLFTRTSETIDEIGIAAACLTTIPQSTFAGFLIRFRPSSDKLLPEFSRYYFRNKSVSEFFAKELCIVTRASLGQERLKSLPVLVPSLKEQKAIAKYLDEKCAAIDALVAEKEALIVDLEAYRKSLIFEVVTGKREVA